MSVTYWVFKKFGVLIVLFYIAVMVILIGSYYQTGVAAPDRLARFFPGGRSYPRTTKSGTIREIYGFPPREEDAVKGTETVDIISYTDQGALVRLDGREQKALTANEVVKQLISRDSAALESGLLPLRGPLNLLLNLHLRFLRGLEASVGGGDSDSLRKLILPKAMVSAAYLGLAVVVWFALSRMDRISHHRAGYSLIYASFAIWPLAVIAVSFAGVNVVDVARHFPDSYHFMHWYVVGGWAAMFAWPVGMAFLSLLDVLLAIGRFDFALALGHAAVLAAGIVTIPLVAVGVFFAIFVFALYVGLRLGKKWLLPAFLRDRLGGILGK